MSGASITLKRTPLYHRHLELGGKLVGFAGWELPVQYSGVIAEHRAVRERAGLFDVSHMGQLFVTGPDAEKALQYMTCNDISVLADGQAQYNAIINERGGVVDDIIVYRFTAQRYLICVNASNVEKDFNWFCKYNPTRAQFQNSSSEYGQIALQGPLAEKIMKDVLGRRCSSLRPFRFCAELFQGADMIVARTGYTGEDGFEIFAPCETTRPLYDSLLETGRGLGLVPAGLGARDALRLEACMTLYGHELADDVTAIESGLGWIVKPDKGDFIGRDVLSRQKKEGASRALAGFFVDDPGIARQGDAVFAGGRRIGAVTSGTKTPTVNRALGLALIESSYSAIDTPLEIEVRGTRLRSHVVKTPFYRRKKI